METLSTTTATLTSIPTAPSTTNTILNDSVPAHHANPVVAFIIGLTIILLASILNAAGLNLTKLDHVRTSSIPKASRRRDWMRPLWLLGILLYILSQLIGSTLALEYMRAEYVAPLGSSSLVFNFLFARFLVGTPVTSTDIYGTIVVVLGVVGIVAFGSINSGLSQGTDAAHLAELWQRPGWLGFFFAMGFALFLLLIFTSSLDAVLVARTDLQAVPFSGNSAAARRAGLGSGNASGVRVRRGFFGKVVSVFASLKAAWVWAMSWVTDMLEMWVAPKDDKQIAWTLGIGWACCGGGLAGGCLVFAKATVKLLSGSLSHQNPGNQFGHVAPIFTIIFLSMTAVLQIICLNRGLRVYDSTLVVPVFYGVYTATGFLDSLIFNNEVDSYQSWTLFLIFISIVILISGVVLLTHKKPEPITGKIKGAATPRTGAVMEERRRSRQGKRRSKKTGDEENQNTDDEDQGGEGEVLWAVGNDSDDDDTGEDEDIDHHLNPLSRSTAARQGSTGIGGGSGGGRRSRTVSGSSAHGRGPSEVTGLMTAALDDDDGDADEESSDPFQGLPRSKQKGKTRMSNRRRSMDPFRDEDDEQDADGARARERELFGVAGRKSGTQ